MALGPQGRGAGDRNSGPRAAFASREWTRRLPGLAAVAVVALLVAFFAVTLNNTMVTTTPMDAIRTGAYPVSVAAGRVETLLVQMRTLSNRVIYIRTDSAIDAVEKSYDEIDAELSRNITLLANSKDRSSVGGSDLEDDYQRLLDAQAQLLDLCRGSLPVSRCRCGGIQSPRPSSPSCRSC